MAKKKRSKPLLIRDGWPPHEIEVTRVMAGFYRVGVNPAPGGIIFCYIIFKGVDGRWHVMGHMDVDIEESRDKFEYCKAYLRNMRFD